MCLKKDYEFHMIGAGDVSYEKKYAEQLLERLNSNQKLAICSGGIYPFVSKDPRGAGRFVRQSFFFKYYDKYPEIMGYETEILHRAMMKAFEIEILNNVKMEHHEKLGHGHNFVTFGRGMKALGYHPAYVLGRFLLEFVKNNNMGRKGACNMLYKYLTYKPQHQGYFSQFPEDIRNEIRTYQTKKIKRFLKNPRHFLNRV